MSEDYTTLINRVSKDIVSKSKSSHVIAEELRFLNKKLNTKNLTRWNSILFMIRSVLKLSPDEIQQIKYKMPNVTAEDKEKRRRFDLSHNERDMLKELKSLLELFEWVTDEFQSNDISISRVYPCVISLIEKLTDTSSDYHYTEEIRRELLSSLNKRFSNLINQDICQLSTFLDPHFGSDLFNEEKLQAVKTRLVSLIQQQMVIDVVQEKVNDKLNEEKFNKIHKAEKKRSEYYVTYKQTNNNISNESKCIEDEIIDYIRYLNDDHFEFTDTLDFWRLNETRFKELSKLAKKFLGVPASSAAVERMFSLAGHIFQSKRRKMGDVLFSNLVFLKLNEKYL